MVGVLWLGAATVVLAAQVLGRLGMRGWPLLSAGGARAPVAFTRRRCRIAGPTGTDAAPVDPCLAVGAAVVWFTLHRSVFALVTVTSASMRPIAAR